MFVPNNPTYFFPSFPINPHRERSELISFITSVVSPFLFKLYNFCQFGVIMNNKGCLRSFRVLKKNSKRHFLGMTGMYQKE